MLFTQAVIAALVTGVWGHGVVQTPEPRTTGTKQEELCGTAVTNKLDSDLAGPIENAIAVADADYKCNAFMCRGYQWEDNVDLLMNVTAGQVIPFHIDLVAGHRPGHANISVIDLATNTAIGEPLITWDDWPTENPDPLADTDFNVTIPDTLADSCNVGGKCAIQWFWYAETNKQTYESCIDIAIVA
ncbi:hypothetical protein GCG54_00007093 [Colletotrichum gloeosporioides]|uniref:Chitin-binding type-4 domain-containing protein n=2 Tax=Colletotrichum gloeosporioides TaxID=474922 RepID=T0KQM2_COLGC|nr:uncharacterized protein GCG54_00007093 [Colletotrichum gloeosporioides]EQB54384.1 hypothetical protein CGLO_05797 [Colletotrichum gloeosporioides Cg-14]KAF3806843.1 hypothetical protein GCG54_00007093 [Colletotrichum gloeosporioides]